MKHFKSIDVQAKDDKEDFRAFLHCTDSSGVGWELRGYGTTAGKSADDAWLNYQRPESQWENWGHTIHELEGAE